MATNDATLYGSILEFAGREDPAGTYAQVIEIAQENNAMISDMIWRPTNAKTMHRTTQRLAYPTPGRRRIDQGVASSKSVTRQVEDKTTRIESHSKVDAMHEEWEGENFDAYRLDEDMAHMVGHNEKVTFDIFYGSTASDPEGIDGLTTRFGDDTGEWADQVYDAGGSGSDNASIWKIGHGPQTFHGIFPKEDVAGMKMEDKGKSIAYDSSNREYEAYRTFCKWSYGISVRDPRAIARMAAIDVSTLQSDTAGTTHDLLDYFAILDERTDYSFGGPVKWCYYTNRNVYGMLLRQALKKSTTHLTLEEAQTAGNKRVLKFLGTPIHRVDALTSTEAAI